MSSKMKQFVVITVGYKFEEILSISLCDLFDQIKFKTSSKPKTCHDLQSSVAFLIPSCSLHSSSSDSSRVWEHCSLRRPCKLYELRQPSHLLRFLDNHECVWWLAVTCWRKFRWPKIQNSLRGNKWHRRDLGCETKSRPLKMLWSES